MPKLNTELFIARRISSPEGGRRNVMVRIATITVALGMAVMIIALAVISGFKHDITEKIVGFGAHVRIVNLDGNNSFETTPIYVDSSLIATISHIPACKNISTYALKGGILKTPDAIEGVALKGIGPDYDISFLAKHLVKGNLPDIADSVRHKEILISKPLADILVLDAGDRVEMMFVSSSQPVRRDRFKICGIYATGMDEMDKAMAFTDIRNVQRLNGWSATQISGYEIMGNNFSQLEQLSDDIYQAVYEHQGREDEVLKVENIVWLNPNIFDWLKAHNVNAIVIIVIMLAVALLNMISAMLIIMLEKTSMIGILKALGMRNGAVQKIFLYSSLRIIATGMLYGNIAGLGIALLQKYAKLIKLDSAGYMISEVPISINWDWLLGLNIGVPVIMTLLLTLPAMVVTSIKPDKTIRYQ